MGSHFSVMTGQPVYVLLLLIIVKNGWPFQCYGRSTSVCAVALDFIVKNGKPFQCYIKSTCVCAVALDFLEIAVCGVTCVLKFYF